MPKKRKELKSPTPPYPVNPLTKDESFVAPTQRPSMIEFAPKFQTEKPFRQVFSRCSQPLFSTNPFWWESFLFLSDDVYKVTVFLFYTKPRSPALPEGEEPVLRSFSIVTSMEFSLSSLTDMVNLLKEGGHVFLHTNYKFPLLSKTGRTF